MSGNSNLKYTSLRGRFHYGIAVSKSFKSSKLGRLSKLGSGLAKASASLAYGKVKDKANEVLSKADNYKNDIEYKLKATREIVETMGEMKGGLMKIGQMISISEDLILPTEISALFSALQRSSSTMAKSDIDDVFLKNFNKLPNELFKDFNYDAIAAASIGQVHKAKLFNAEQVAVKVQYPKITKAIKNDFKNVESIKKLFKLIYPNLPNIDHIIEDVRKSILDECNYILEAQNAIEFRNIYKDNFPNIIVPNIYDKYSSKEILTMEFLEGDKFEETLNYTQQQRDFLGELLYSSFMYSFYVKNKLHTDPQNGNYLFKTDKIILLDFGSSRKFKKDFVQTYSNMLKSVEIIDYVTFRECMLKLNIALPNETIEETKKYFNIIDGLFGYYFKEGTFPVRQDNPIKLVTNFLRTINIKGRTTPIEELAHLDRATIGLYAKLKKWQSHINWKQSQKKYRDPIDEKIF